MSTDPFDLIKRHAEDTGISKGPHAWIQWKGTSVCMDVHCSCGKHSHVDDSFTYYFACECGQLYTVSSYITLLPIAELPEGVSDHAVARNVEGWK